MNNEIKSEVLFIDACVYSVITVVLIGLSLLFRNVIFLNWALASFVFLTLSFFMSYLFAVREKVSLLTMIVSFLILMPMAFVIYVFTFIVTFISMAFRKGGGDDKDEK